MGRGGKKAAPGGEARHTKKEGKCEGDNNARWGKVKRRAAAGGMWRSTTAAAFACSQYALCRPYNPLTQPAGKP